ncbi:deazaflavin-dependent oxidoreductase (nitroreductase family) [Williamsia muralis]|uniref:Deazaflavin-dependent oxidoreductase (Nitroreductase family) n=1 Tax=Williamsia marianensis TaxID=85044 RepID=A0A495K084_WILMA|nr:nitroreductase family deazaflavin-dependent oxidoreductase [Williamsia muralis]RKR94660.1 deazaflavin-dependent oxidoreductase (nitroreductase family) [Williamsia muralis]
MTDSKQADSRKNRGKTPGRLSRWMQQRTNSRTITRIRRGKATFMGMDLLVLHTVGRRTGEPRQSPVTWFDDGDGVRLIIASGGGDQNPDWFANLMAAPDQASMEMPGQDVVAVTPRRLEGPEREQAWQRIVEAQPRYAKYQQKSDRQYPVVRLTPR